MCNFNGNSLLMLVASKHERDTLIIKSRLIKKIQCFLMFLLIVFLFPLMSQATMNQLNPLTLTPRQEIARKIVWLAFNMGVQENLAVEISSCESGLKNIRSLRQNKNGTYDHGVMQINEINIPEAKKLGFDIFDENDNIRFGLFLIARDGALRHYRSSVDCWFPQLSNLGITDG